jgi:hypothetical protein
MFKNIRFYISEILKNDAGVYSSTTLWFHLGNTAIIVAYLLVIWNAVKVPPIPVEGLTFFTLIIGGLVAGSKLAGKLINAKYGSTSLEVKQDGTDK